MFLPLMRDRILQALTGTPDVLNALLSALSPHDPVGDARPDPERFSLREIVAHLADYEPIWLDRITRTRTENDPVFIPVDPGALAVEHDYAHSDVTVSLARFCERRAVLAAYLSGVEQDDWLKVGQMGDRSPLTLEEQAAFVVIHDGYHTGQVAQCLAAGRR